MAHIHAARIAQPHGNGVLSVRLCRQRTMPYQYIQLWEWRLFSANAAAAQSTQLYFITYLNHSCCLHRSNINRGGTGEPEELLGMHQSRFALRYWCYFIVKEHK